MLDFDKLENEQTPEIETRVNTPGRKVIPLEAPKSKEVKIIPKIKSSSSERVLITKIIDTTTGELIDSKLSKDQVDVVDYIEKISSLPRCEIKGYKSKVNKDRDKLHSKLIKMGIKIRDNKRVDKFISTGSKSLDSILGGGYVRGKLSQLVGWESSGKTSFAYHGMREAQKEGLKCCFIDFERTYTDERAKAVGINTDELLVIEPDYLEEGFESIRTLCRDGGYKFFVFDSLGAADVYSDMNNDIGEKRVLNKPMVIGRSVKNIRNDIYETGSVLLILNQFYKTMDQYKPKEVSGGTGLAYETSQLIEIERNASKKSQVVTSTGKMIGQMMRFTIKKNKIDGGKLNASIETTLYYKGSIAEIGAIIDLVEEYGIVTKEGLTYYIGGIKVGVKSKFIEIFSYCKEYFYSELKWFANEVTKAEVLISRHIQDKKSVGDEEGIRGDGNLNNKEILKVKGLTDRVIEYFINNNNKNDNK